MRKFQVLFISIVLSSFIISCNSDNENLIEKEEFNLAFIEKNIEYFKPISVESISRRTKLLNRNTIDLESLEYLVNKENLTNSEETELQNMVVELGFNDIPEYKNYLTSLNNLGGFLVDNTNIEDLNESEVNQVLLDYYESVGLYLPGRNCASDYQQCENDVSTALGLDLLNCAVQAGVAGLFGSGIGGLIVGASCTGIALYNASQASAQCLQQFQDCQNNQL